MSLGSSREEVGWSLYVTLKGLTFSPVVSGHCGGLCGHLVTIWQLAEIGAYERMKTGDLRGSRERRKTQLRVRAVAIREMGQSPAWSGSAQTWLWIGLELLFCAYDLRQKGPHCGKWSCEQRSKAYPGEAFKRLRVYFDRLRVGQL